MKQSLLNMTSIYDHLNILMNFSDRGEYAMNIAIQVHGEDDYWLTKCETHDEPFEYHLGYYLQPFIDTINTRKFPDRSLYMGFTEHGEPYAGF